MKKNLIQKKGILKFVLACSIFVSSIPFSSNSTLAQEITIDNGYETPAANSIRNTTYYKSGNVLNIQPQSTIVVEGNIYEGSISGITDLIINGNGSLIDSQSTNNNLNYGYQLTNGASIQINDTTFNSFGYDVSVDGLSSVSKYSYGAGLYIQDDTSSASLNNVAYTNSLLKGDGNLIATSNFYGAAIANNGTLNITGSVIRDNIIQASNRYDFSSSGEAYGGGIYNNGRLTLTNVEVSSNSVTSVNTPERALGGGIYTTKDITLAGGNYFNNNTDDSGANDIYFENGNLIVNASGSDTINIISSGLASGGNSDIILSDSGKLLLEGDNTRFINGNAMVGAKSILTYSGALNESILAGTTTVNG